MSETSLEAVKEALGTRTNARGYRMFSKSARVAAVSYATTRMSGVATTEQVMVELGLNDWTLSRWIQEARRRRSTGRRPKGFVRLEVKAPEVEPLGLVVLGPCGLRIEGLGVDALALLMKKVSCLA
jgi:transposase-like protein